MSNSEIPEIPKKCQRFSRDGYSRVAKAIKDRLVVLVINDGISVKNAADSLGINYNTARYIIASYKKQQLIGGKQL